VIEFGGIVVVCWVGDARGRETRKGLRIPVVVVLVQILGMLLGLVVADGAEGRALVELILEVEGTFERPEAGPHRASTHRVLVVVHLHAAAVVLELGRGERQPCVGSRVE
jgi:hypothetical protein